MTFSTRSVRMQASKLLTPAALGPLLTAAAALVVLLLESHPLLEDGSCALTPVSGPVPRAPGNATDSNAVLTLLESLEQRCSSMNKDFETLQKEVPDKGQEALPAAARSLQSLLDFEVQYVDTMSAVEVAHASYHLLNTSNVSAEQLAEQRFVETGRAKRTANRLCFLQLVTAARRLAATLPLDAGNANGALGCEQGILSGLEDRAVREAEAQAAAEASAKTLLYLGVHWSEIAISGLSDRSDTWAAWRPEALFDFESLFGSGSDLLFGSEAIASADSSHALFGPGPSSAARAEWVRDSWGTMVPSEIAHAEDYLTRSTQVSGRKVPSLKVLHAHRLQAHAEVLDALGQHEASAQRYRAMAKLAEQAGNFPLSAHALSQLSHSLNVQGLHEGAIAAANDAVSMTMDPLAQFVLATARLSSGLLITEDDVKTAELQLKAAAGQLPTQELEVQRAKTLSQFNMWRWVSKDEGRVQSGDMSKIDDMSKCGKVTDAAQFVICTLCKLVF